jgi:hypothetical protein
VEDARRAASRAGITTWIIGEIVPGKTGVRFGER